MHEKYGVIYTFDPQNTLEIACYKSSRLQMFFKKVFLKMSQISQENTCAGVTFNKVIGPRAVQHSCFPANFAKYLRTSFI